MCARQARDMGQAVPSQQPLCPEPSREMRSGDPSAAPGRAALHRSTWCPAGGCRPAPGTLPLSPPDPWATAQVPHSQAGLEDAAHHSPRASTWLGNMTLPQQADRAGTARGTWLRHCTPGTAQLDQFGWHGDRAAHARDRVSTAHVRTGHLCGPLHPRAPSSSVGWASTADGHVGLCGSAMLTSLSWVTLEPGAPGSWHLGPPETLSIALLPTCGWRWPRAPTPADVPGAARHAGSLHTPATAPQGMATPRALWNPAPATRSSHARSHGNHTRERPAVGAPSPHMQLELVRGGTRG